MMRTSRGKINNVGNVGNVVNSRVSKADPAVNNYVNDDGRAKLA